MRIRTTAIATGRPAASAPGPRWRPRATTTAAAMTSSSAPRVAEVPWPTTRASSPVTVMIAPKPTAGSSQDQASRPEIDSRARPTSIEAAQISAAEA